MNILHIIGNGFDINLDISTAYSDFYKYYLDTSSNSTLVEKLKSEIAIDTVTWSDLELSFGKFASKLKSIHELDEVYDDIQNHLIKYLGDKENESDGSIRTISSNDFFNDLVYPENYLGLNKKRVEEFKNKHKNTDININVTTLNYTRTIEKITGFKGEKIKIGSHENNTIYLENIFHVHGTINNQMVLGVNDANQITNPALIKDPNVLDTLVKTRRNQAYLNENNSIFSNYIKNADLICVFGCSIGWTDRTWWSQINHKLRGNSILILFGRGPKYNAQMSYKYLRTANGLKDHFINMATADETFKKNARQNIITGIRTNIFNLMNSK